MTLDRLVRQVAAHGYAPDEGLTGDILSLTDTPGSLVSNTELLLPLDQKGGAVPLLDATVDRVQAALTASPSLGRWLQLAKLGGQRVLLVARWLCHRVGLRHRTVQIILDHPVHPAYTLIQLRGFDKIDAPGAFDMPCAGHVIGTDTIEVSLAKELREELGLEMADLVDLRHLGHYEFRDLDQRPDFYNVEYRAVYRARLREAALERVSFTDGEVAGLAVMPVTALRAMVAHSPERVASGLRGAMPWYREEHTREVWHRYLK